MIACDISENFKGKIKPGNALLDNRMGAHFHNKVFTL